MSLAHAAGQALAAEGAIARASASFQPRQAQTEMAQAVAEVIENGGALVVEAGTGIGKTFAYLVPALLSGERVLLSTATQTLQDQLFGRDLPRLARALGLPTRMALLKGRASYLCVHRLGLARQEADQAERGFTRASLKELAQIETWAQQTQSGDLAELTELDERSLVLPWVTSTRENCLGSTCPKFLACHVHQARKEALAADLVVVNHHLFFADLAVRESGMAELLPTVRVVIFDEAHRLNETGIQFFGRGLSTGQLLDLARDLLAAGLAQARGLADWPQLAAALDRAAREWRLSAAGINGRVSWLEAEPEGVNALVWQTAVQAVLASCQQVMKGLNNVMDLGPDFARLHERVTGIVSSLAAFEQPCATAAVRWAETSADGVLRLMESPLDIAQTVRSRLLGEGSPNGQASVTEQNGAGQPPTPESAAAGLAAGPAPRARAWVFTSATLGHDAQLSWFTEPCGLTKAKILKLGSPFDYPSQAALYVPQYLVRPSDAAHSRQVADLVANAALALGGRTLVLTTTLRALREIGAALASRFHGHEGQGQLEVLIQGQMPKRHLMARFAQAGAGLGRILVASASFREGVDLPGEVLQLVVMDKLPFPPPGDPLVQARSRQLEAAGRSAFSAYTLPEAAVALKQGAGRLIRSETDRGILVICDTRLTGMGYGKRLLAGLPAMRRLQSEAEFQQALAALAALTRPSTTDL